MYHDILSLRTTSVLQMQVCKKDNIRIFEYLAADEHASFSNLAQQSSIYIFPFNGTVTIMHVFSAQFIFQLF